MAPVDKVSFEETDLDEKADLFKLISLRVKLLTKRMTLKQ